MACHFSESCLGMCKWTNCPNAGSGKFQIESTAFGDQGPGLSQPWLLNAAPHQPLPFMSFTLFSFRTASFVQQYVQEEAALFQAANNGDLATVRKLIEAQVNVNSIQEVCSRHMLCVLSMCKCRFRDNNKCKKHTLTCNN